MHKQKVARISLYLFIVLSLAVSLNTTTSYSSEISCELEILEPATKTPSDKFKKGYCFNIIGEHEKAVKSLKRLERKLPVLRDYIHFIRADSYRALGKTKDAKKLYKEIALKSQNSILEPKAKQKLAEIFRENGQYNDAIVILKNLYETEPSSWEKSKYINEIAKIHNQRNDLSAAYSTYRKIWANHPQTTYSVKVFDAARKAETVFTPTQGERLTRANNLFNKQLWEPALNELQSLTLTSEVNEKIGICLYNTARHREAYNILKDISSPEALYWRGRALNKLGRSSEATETLISIHNLFPHHKLAPKSLYKATIIEEQRGRLSNAVNISKTLLRKYPSSDEAPDAAWKLGRTYYKRGMYSNALEVFSNFSYPPNSFKFQSFEYWKGKSLEELGRKFEAFSTYRSIAKSPYFTYHSFLARKKIDHNPRLLANTTPVNAFRGNISKQKALLLIEMGIYNLAEQEIKYLETIANTKKEKIVVSSLYEKTQNYYKSTNIANNVQHPSAFQHSFPKPFSIQVKTFSQKYGLDELLVYSLIREESRFNKNAISRSNARGLMQLIPVTARETADMVGIYAFNLNMLFEPQINVELGSYYLRRVMDRYQGELPLALASYNAGPGRVAEWLREYRYSKIDEFIEEIPFNETRKYVKRILRSYGAYKALYFN